MEHDVKNRDAIQYDKIECNTMNKNGKWLDTHEYNIIWYDTMYSEKKTWFRKLIKWLKLTIFKQQYYMIAYISKQYTRYHFQKM